MQRLASPFPLGRRAFLGSIARIGALSGAAHALSWGRMGRLLAQAGPAADPRIVRSLRPQDLETPLGLLDSWITPNHLFYVRSHLYTPAVDPAAFVLTVEGDVERRLQLSLDELKRMPRVSQPVTLECAGNGRAFFDPPVAGVQWQRGAVGNAQWTGVRLADVLKAAGLKPSARFVWMNGADTPLGTMPDFIRQVPLAKAIDPDTLLAYEMNGQPLPVANGFPLRAIVPGWEAAYSIKWLTHLDVRDREHDGFWVQTAYKYPTRRVAPGAAVDPAHMAPLAGLAVKSIITAPLDGAVVPAGDTVVSGFAWAGEAGITRVDVSVDNGSTWHQATLGDDQARYAWRQFRFTWRPDGPGSFVVLARATDDRGRVQPIVAHWNPSGYLWNAVERVRVHVS